MKKLFSILITIILAFSSVSVILADSKDTSLYVNEILENKLAAEKTLTYQKLIDKFAENPGSGEEFYVISIRNTSSGVNYEKYRTALLNYIKNTKFTNATSELKAALTYLAVNGNPDEVDFVVDECCGKLGIMSYVYSLHVLNNNGKSNSYSKEDIINQILELETKNGGWNISGEYPDTDVTAMVIQSLAPFYNSNSKVEEAVKRSLEILSSRQNDNGTYSSYGVKNPETASQVLMMLSSLGIDAQKDERFIKNGNTVIDGIRHFYLDDGTYSHIENGDSNGLATIQALYSLISYNRFLENKSPYYLFDELTEPEITEFNTGKTISTKTYLYIAIGILSLLAVIFNIVKKKKSYKSYLTVLIVCALAAFAVHSINIQKVDDYYKEEEITGKAISTTISITCHTIEGQKSYIPKDGIILDNVTIEIQEGKTAYDQLIAAVKKYKLHIQSTSSYVSAIENIYELDFGDLSGWMYRVNGNFASVGCGEYILKESDVVEWLYTTNLGEDIGNTYIQK